MVGNLGSGQIISIEDDGVVEDEVLEESRPIKKQRVGHRTKAESYTIDDMRYETSQKDLDRLR